MGERMTGGLLHEQYEDREGRAVLFECADCGYLSLSLGSLHGHAERHRGYTRFGIQIPFTRTSPGRFDELMNYTRVIAVEDSEEIELVDVQGL